MAFIKTANAKVQRHSLNVDDWNAIRKGSLKGKVRISSDNNTISEYSPDKYLLTHCTIIASVDVDEKGPKNDKGWHYYITPETEKFVNSNQDAWQRDLLLATYHTFKGAENYCFGPNTKILMSDGTYKFIENVQIGDMVITHEGNTKKVIHTFCRDIAEEVCDIRFDRFKDHILVTKNHPFRSLHIEAPPVSRYKTGKLDSHLRYRKDAIVSAIRNNSGPLADKINVEEKWTQAKNVVSDTFVLGPKNELGTLHINEDRAVLLGYYLAEGCQLVKTDCIENSHGVVITPGFHETEVVKDILTRVERSFPDTKVSVTPTQSSTWYVRLEGKEIGQWLLKYGGQHAATKYIHPEVFSWDKGTLLLILSSWLNGDGSLGVDVAGSRMRGHTTSEKLACQMQRISELCGIKCHITFREITGKNIPSGRVFNYMTANGNVISYPIIPRHDLWELFISRDQTEEIRKKSVRWKNYKTQASRKRSEFGFWNDYRVHKVTSNNKIIYSGKVYNLEVEDDNSYVIYPGVAVHNCEHIQIPELSKGKIIDAVARDIGDSVYIDILVATDRKHTDLVADIENGDITTLSMGCSCTFTLCTKCGNIAHDETDMCECIKYSKGNNFFDSKGKRRIIAELCGHLSDPESVVFIEASWVANPAFKGAVMRNILTAADVTENQIKEAYAINRIIDPDALQKAASRNKNSSFNKIGDFNFDEDPSLDDGGSGEAAPAPKEEKEPIKDLTDEMKNLIRNRVKRELREELQDFKDPNKDLTDNNENMIRSNFAFTSFKNRYASYGNDLALYRLYEGLVSVKTAGWKSLKYKGYTGREILALSHFIDVERGSDSLDKKYYAVIARLGGTDPYKTPLEYLSKIGKETDIKKMSVKLAKQLIYKGNLYNCGV